MMQFVNSRVTVAIWGLGLELEDVSAMELGADKTSPAKVSFQIKLSVNKLNKRDTNFGNYAAFLVKTLSRITT